MISNDILNRLEKISLVEALALTSELYPGQTYFSTSLGQEDQVSHTAYTKLNVMYKRLHWIRVACSTKFTNRWRKQDCVTGRTSKFFSRMLQM